MNKQAQQALVAEMKKVQMRYCRGMTIPRTVPVGRVLVHNHVRPNEWLGKPVTSRDWFVGMNGFRAWTQLKTARLVRCDCGWAPIVPEHYRINFDKENA